MSLLNSIKTSSLILSFLSFVFLFSCEDKKSGETVEQADKKTVKEEAKVNVPDFNADSAYKYIKDQVDFGPRVPNSDEHKACAKYLEAKLKSWGAKTYVQNFEATAFDGTVLTSFNIVGSVNPTAKKRILLGSHWDSRPFADQEEDHDEQRKPIDGANDGASGVGVLMEIVRTIQAASEKPNVGVDVILFDSEDYGAPEFHTGNSSANFWCLGSQYWAKNKHIPGYRAFYGILLDMVGAKDATFFKEGVSMNYAPSIVRKVWTKGQKLGHANHFVDKSCPGITDDHTFVNQMTGIPMIDIIQYNHENEEQFFGEYWHTHDDTIDVIDKETLDAVGETVLHVLYEEK